MSERATGRTIRSRTGIVWLVGTALVAAALLVDVLLRGGPLQLVLIAPWLLLPVWLAWAFFTAPGIRVDAAGAVVRNPLRTTAFGWSRVETIRSRWQVAFALTDGRTVQAYGAPAAAPGRRRANEQADGVVEELEALRSAAGAADAPVTARWNLDALIPLAVLVVWAAAAVAVTR
jgi:hypothetical protein